MSKKGIIFDIKRASFNDGPGIRTTVFLKGCPLNCLWCHNPEGMYDQPQLFFYHQKCNLCDRCRTVCENGVHRLTNGIHEIDYDKCVLCGRCADLCSSSALKIVGVEMDIEGVLEKVMADVDFYKTSGGGITLSGGEPLFQFDFSLELLKQSKKRDLNTCLETSGHLPTEQFKQILPFVDTLLYDYKLTGPVDYKKYAGVDNGLIMENLRVAYAYGVPIILRCPIIPGINDTDQHFEAICALDKEYPDFMGIDILPYHTMGNGKRTSLGMDETFTNLKTIPHDISEMWINKLREMGCAKATLR